MSCDPNATVDIERLHQNLNVFMLSADQDDLVPRNHTVQSMADLMLTVLGWKFAEIEVESPEQAAAWLQRNLGDPEVSDLGTGLPREGGDDGPSAAGQGTDGR